MKLNAAAVIVLATLATMPARGAEVIDRVLAVAAGQVITLTDVTGARDLGLQSATGAPDPIRAVLAKLIDRALMLAEVDRYSPPEPAPELVERGLQTVRSRFVSNDAYQATLSRSGFDEKHLRETIRQDLRLQSYLDQRFTATDARRQVLIDEWLAGLRRRGTVVDLYLSGK